MSTNLVLAVLFVALILISIAALGKGGREGFRDGKALVVGLMVPVFMLLFWLAMMLFGFGISLDDM